MTIMQPMEGDADASRRATPRQPLYARTKLRTSSWEGYGYTVNLSLGGVAIQLPYESAQVPLGLGDAVELDIHLPARSAPVTRAAQVAWRSEPLRGGLGPHVVNLGVRLLSEATADEHAIATFLAKFKHRVLACDAPAELLSTALGGMFEVVECTAEELRDCLPNADAAAVVLGDAGGVDALVRLVRAGRWASGETGTPIPVIVLTARWPEALGAGPLPSRSVFKQLPVEPQELATLVLGCAENYLLSVENRRLNHELEAALKRLRSENTVLRNELNRPLRLPGFIGTSAPMLATYAMIERVAPVDSSVLVTGETGTGKELTVRALHQLSHRASKPLIIQNCAGLTDTLLESELFGYKRGAFTGATEDRSGLFEEANGGTLFLDEVAEMSVAMQAKLLRVLQDGEFRRVGDSKTRTVDVRVIAATHADLQERVAARTFREDLYYRLGTFLLRLPPLRERAEDIAELTLHFLAELSARYRREAPGLTQGALDVFAQYKWPGNVRQLRQVCERVAILARPGVPISAAAVVDAIGVRQAAEPEPTSFQAAMDAFERRLIEDALRKTDHIITRAALVLDLDRSTLSRHCKRLGIQV